MKKALSIFAIALLLVSCGPKKKEVKLIPAENFNTVVEGKNVSLYTLHNSFLTMQVTNYKLRSEERLVGKERRSRWSPYH